MKHDPQNTYDFLSRAYKLIKVLAVALGSVAATSASFAIFVFKDDQWWSATRIPISWVAVILVLTIAIFTVLTVVTALLLKDGLSALSFYRNKSDNLDARLSQLKQVAFMDSITGMPNSRALEAEINQGEKSPRCLILLDLVGFGQINKRFNHWRGDEYLRKFSQMVTLSSRRNETLFKRRPDKVLSDEGFDHPHSNSIETVRAFRKNSGGDEFYILLEGTIVDGLGFLNRLGKRTWEFEEMSRNVLGNRHEFRFHAGLVRLGDGEDFESANQRVSECLAVAMDKDSPSWLYWREGDHPDTAESPIPQSVYQEIQGNFTKPYWFPRTQNPARPFPPRGR